MWTLRLPIFSWNGESWCLLPPGQGRSAMPPRHAHQAAYVLPHLRPLVGVFDPIRMPRWLHQRPRIPQQCCHRLGGGGGLRGVRIVQPALIRLTPHTLMLGVRPEMGLVLQVTRTLPAGAVLVSVLGVEVHRARIQILPGGVARVSCTKKHCSSTERDDASIDRIHRNPGRAVIHGGLDTLSLTGRRGPRESGGRRTNGRHQP